MQIEMQKLWRRLIFRCLLENIRVSKINQYYGINSFHSAMNSIALQGSVFLLPTKIEKRQKLQDFAVCLCCKQYYEVPWGVSVPLLTCCKNCEGIDPNDITRDLLQIAIFWTSDIWEEFKQYFVTRYKS